MNRVLSHIGYIGEDVLLNIKGPHVLVDLALSLEKQELLLPRPITWGETGTAPPRPSTWVLCCSSFQFHVVFFYILCLVSNFVCVSALSKLDFLSGFSNAYCKFITRS